MQCGCDVLFDDRRLISGLLLIWTLISCATFAFIMIEDNSKFLNIGPSTVNTLFGVVLDSWFKWWAVAIYTFISTAIAAFSSDSIAPWITNTIQDHKTRYIPYHPYMCWLIIQIFTLYVVTQSTIGLFVALTQVDFMLIRLFADMIVNHFTTFWFLRNKTYDPHKYKYEQEQELQNNMQTNINLRNDAEMREMREMRDDEEMRSTTQTEMDTLVT